VLVRCGDPGRGRRTAATPLGALRAAAAAAGAGWANWRCESSTFLNIGFSAERFAITSSQTSSWRFRIASGVL
jgi:hypothetical protein